MTYRQYLTELLNDRTTSGETKCAEAFRELFGCGQISVKICVKCDGCVECYKRWLDTEVENHGNA